MAAKKNTPSQEVNKLLLELNQTDFAIHGHESKRDLVQRKRKAYQLELGNRKDILEACQEELDTASSKKDLELGRLKEEEKKIIERRNQLGAIGGAKAAKIVEKEIEISSRSLQLLEDNAKRATSLASKLEERVELVKEKVSEIEGKSGSEHGVDDKELVAIEKELASLAKRREKLVDSVQAIDKRIMPLYERIKTRFPGSVVAIAQVGSCRSCFRALPYQLYNQVLAGNSMLQCPGCSRLIVCLEADIEAAA